MKGDVIVWIFDNYLWILGYLIIGVLLCSIFKKYCITRTKKEQKGIDKINKKNLYLNRIDIIKNKVFYIMLLIGIGIIYLMRNLINLGD